MNAITIKQVETPGDIAQVTRLFQDYQNWLNEPVCFQSFEKELAALPAPYQPPNGALLLALDPENKALGCVALKIDDEQRLEMKRLYVVEAARNQGIAQQLLDHVETLARQMAARIIFLETLPSLTSAIKLYQKRGYKTENHFNTNKSLKILFMCKKV